ncbi:hypothetical protein HDV05_002132 [Chytridiales sp. JEL 0842]|nr:hypothetical protein HDV05_002132 [Chytridiales sp. JEL 0842]
MIQLAPITSFLAGLAERLFQTSTTKRSNWLAILVFYPIVVRYLRYRHVQKIKRLPPPTSYKDAHQFVRSMSLKEFPWLCTTGTEFGLFRTYAIPSISKLLVATTQLSDPKKVGRRYDDTDLLVREFMENGLDTPRAQVALRRMNAHHARYRIANQDFLYVLAVFVCEPIRWVERYGYRKLLDVEKQAMYLYWKEIGIRMSLVDIPPTLEDLFNFYDAFEAKYMVPAETNIKMGGATVVRIAMGFPTPNPFLVALGDIILKTHGLFTGYFLLPRLKWAGRTTENVNSAGKRVVAWHKFERTYEDGYIIEKLGPVQYENDGKLGELGVETVKSMGMSGACPFGKVA